MSNNTDLAKYSLKFEELQAKVWQARQILQKIVPDKSKQRAEEENHGSGSSVSIYVKETVTANSPFTGSSEMSPAHKKQRLTGPAFGNGKWKNNILQIMRKYKLLVCNDEILVNMKTWSEEHMIEFVDNSCQKVPMFYAQPKDEQLKQIRTFCEEKSIRFLLEEDDEEEEKEEKETDKGSLSEEY